MRELDQVYLHNKFIKIENFTSD